MDIPPCPVFQMAFHQVIYKPLLQLNERFLLPFGVSTFISDHFVDINKMVRDTTYQITV